MACIDLFFNGPTQLKYETRKMFRVCINDESNITVIMRPDQCMNCMLEEVCASRNINIKKCWVSCDKYKIKNIHFFKKTLAYIYRNDTIFILFDLP